MSNYDPDPPQPPDAEFPLDPAIAAAGAPLELGRLRDPGTGGASGLAWLVIAGCIGLILLLHTLVAAGPTESPDKPTPTDGVLKLISRYSVGALEIAGASGAGGQADSLREQLIETVKGAAVSRDDRVRAALLSFGAGDDAAARQLLGDAIKIDDNSADKALPEYLAADADRVGAMIDAGADALPAEDRAALIDHHGWFAEYALTRGLDADDPARRAAIAPATRVLGAMLTLGFLAGGGLLVGVILLVVLLMKRSAGGLRPRYAPPAPGGSVFLETFAVFLVAFLFVQAIGGFFAGLTGFDPTPALLWLMPLVLLWPIARGATRAQVKYAVGLHRGSGFVREVAAGLIGYLAGLPVVAVGFIITLILGALLSAISGPGAPPSHPIVQQAGSTGIWPIVSLYLLASVWAPIVEESVFRGALFHHLRGRMRALASALAVGLIFAIIHPQGVLLVPPLMALGFVFSMIREWRGSLIGPMAAHAVHNAVLVTVLLVAMR